MEQTLLEQMREKEQKNRFTVHNHIKMEELEPDRAVFALEIGADSRNSYGMVHGGALYAMADNAAGFAAHTDGRHYVTQNSDFHFLRNQPQGVIRAEARVRHRGGSTCLVEVEITGREGRTLATGLFTFFRVNPDQVRRTL